MAGESIDEWRKSSRVSAASSISIMLLAMLLLLLLPALAQAATLKAVSDPAVAELPLTGSSDPNIYGWAGFPTNELFGRAVSVSGTTAVVGAPNTGTGHVGSVYVYAFANGNWQLRQTITAPKQCSWFGYSVSVSGNYLIVGDPTYRRNGGAVFMYKRVASPKGDSWTFQFQRDAYGATGDSLGASVSVSGHTFIAGAELTDVSSKYIARTKQAGAAYVYHDYGEANPNWYECRLTLPKPKGQDHFGHRVSISGDTAIVTSSYYGAGVERDGSAYVYRRRGDGLWSKEATLTNGDSITGDTFGDSVAIRGDTALIGAPTDGGEGAVYVYKRANKIWSRESKLIAPDGRQGDHFGSSVSLWGDAAMVGAPYVDDAQLTDVGAVYYYSRTGTTWEFGRKATARNHKANATFGNSVAISGNNAFVGQPGSREAFIHARLLGYETNEETPLTVPVASGVLVNDQYVNATPVLVNTQSLHGTINLAGDGSFVFRPEPHFNGTATATYRLTSGSAASNPATIGIYVDPVNHAPVARDDIATLTPDGTLLQLDEEGKGLLANDSDVDGDKLTISVQPDRPKHAGLFGILPDGSFSYVPRAAFVGTDTFTYTLADEHGATDTGKVTFKVAPDEPPVAMDDSEIRESKLFSLTQDKGTSIGWSVAVSGDTAIVGARNETTPTVYSYRRNGSVWNLEQRLRSPNPGNPAGFGTALSVSGNTMAISSPGVGLVYVYTRASDTSDWTYSTLLEGCQLEDFGCSVSVSGDTIVVGAKNADVGRTSQAGAVYIYKRTPDGWGSRSAELYAPTPEAGAHFGSSVSFSGDQVIVGAPDAPNPDHTALGSGAAYVFERSLQSTWTGVQLPMPATAGSHFGYSVSISGDTVAVGAIGEGVGSGAGYVFVKWEENGHWLLQKKLIEEGAKTFGNSVSVAGDNLIIGAPGDGSDGPAAYVYSRFGNGWSRKKRLTSTQHLGQYGWAVGVSDGTAVVGAPFNDAAGAAYVETGLSSYSTDQDTALFVPGSSGVLINDRPIDLTPELVDVSNLHGHIEFLDGGAFFYDPDPFFTGIATAKYRVTDGRRVSEPATITIAVNAASLPPQVIRDGQETVKPGQKLTVPAPGVLKNVTDVDGDTLLVCVDQPPKRADGFSLSSDGSYYYVPRKDAHQDSFTYWVFDGRGGVSYGRVFLVFQDPKPRRTTSLP